MITKTNSKDPVIILYIEANLIFTQTKGITINNDFISFFMKVLWPHRFANIDNKMSIQNPSDALIWLSMIFWFTMWGFRTMFPAW